MRCLDQQTAQSVADLSTGERSLLAFICQLAVIDPKAARGLALVIESEAFADELCGSIAAATFAIARTGPDRIDLADIVNRAQRKHGCARGPVKRELTEAFRTFEQLFAPLAS